MRARLAAAAACLLAGCASIDPYARPPIAQHLLRDDAVGDCARLFQAADGLVRSRGVRDAQEPRVPGFPYLRVDRFTSALAEDVVRRRAWAPWTERMAELDRRARALEARNAAPAMPAPAAALDACRYALAVADAGATDELLQAAQVPDEYSTSLRVLGLYPLTRLLFAAGIAGWQSRTQAVFDQPLASLPVAGELLRYVPEPAVRQLPHVARSAALGLPALADAQWRALLLRHAPALVVDTVTDDDRIGTPVWPGADGGAGGAADAAAQAASRPRVDPRTPAGYARVTFTRLGARVLPQLVYTFWFPARPPAHAFDVLAGAFDGLIWRVTLGEDLGALVYDSIHPCGCYHLFFPTERVRARAGRPAGEGRFDEGLFAPQTVRAPAPDERIELRVASRTHYLQRVTVVPADAAAGALRYALHDEDALRALPLDAAGNTRSLYGSDGFVAGTQRAERFLFWPMGIASAGQMRQWGRHATAFVGRRHFDDPHLIDRYFAVEAYGRGAGEAAPAAAGAARMTGPVAQ